MLRCSGGVRPEATKPPGEAGATGTFLGRREAPPPVSYPALVLVGALRIEPRATLGRRPLAPRAAIAAFARREEGAARAGAEDGPAFAFAFPRPGRRGLGFGAKRGEGRGRGRYLPGGLRRPFHLAGLGGGPAGPGALGLASGPGQLLPLLRGVGIRGWGWSASSPDPPQIPGGAPGRLAGEPGLSLG